MSVAVIALPEELAATEEASSSATLPAAATWPGPPVPPSSATRASQLANELFAASRLLRRLRLTAMRLVRHRACRHRRRHWPHRRPCMRLHPRWHHCGRHLKCSRSHRRQRGSFPHRAYKRRPTSRRPARLGQRRRLRAGRGGHADTARTNFRYQFNPGDADPGAAAGQPRTGAAAVIV